MLKERGIYMTNVHYMKPISEQMHPADIKAGLHKAGETMRSVAIKAGVGETSISQVIYGRSSSRRVAETIAEVLEKSIHDIWPDRYKEKESA